MSSLSDNDYFVGLVTELRKLPAETGWVEFKENITNPNDIGEYLSALSNSAALDGKANAYLVWGVQDGTHDVVGTSFKPSKAKKGNEDLENWLRRQLSPSLHFRWYAFEYEQKPVVLLEIPRASGKPTQFSGVELIRVGSCRQKLKTHPELEKKLWQIFETTLFEDLIAKERIDTAEVLKLIDYPAYFKLLSRPLPSDHSRILDALAEDYIIQANAGGSWDITNLGAILFAQELNEFKRLSRKAVRVIVYEGRGRLKTRREQTGRLGYAAGFEKLIDYINTIVPRNEVVGQALRKDVPMYPELAIRELVANALIHQDFSVTGSGPMIEIFDDRMEITNPGLPLMTTERFLDTPPRSRNEALASLMRHWHR
jgi:ATP-dependent DNA helicase RecG